MFLLRDVMLLLFGGRNESLDYVNWKEFINSQAQIYDKDTLPPRKKCDRMLIHSKTMRP